MGQKGTNYPFMAGLIAYLAYINVNWKGKHQVKSINTFKAVARVGETRKSKNKIQIIKEYQ